MELGRPTHAKSKIVSIVNNNVGGNEIDEEQYSTYESAPVSSTTPSSSSALRHCLACDRYGHTALNCPAPNTACIISNYGIYNHLLLYASVQTDATVITGSDDIINMTEPIDEPPPVTTVPTYSAYASILEPTFSDDDDGPSEPRKRKRGQGRKKANNETGKIRTEEGTSRSTVEEANILGTK